MLGFTPRYVATALTSHSSASEHHDGRSRSLRLSTSAGATKVPCTWDHTHRKSVLDTFALDINSGRTTILQPWLQGESARVRDLVLVTRRCETALSWTQTDILTSTLTSARRCFASGASRHTMWPSPTLIASRRGSVCNRILQCDERCSRHRRGGRSRRPAAARSTIGRVIKPPNRIRANDHQKEVHPVSSPPTRPYANAVSLPPGPPGRSTYRPARATKHATRPNAALSLPSTAHRQHTDPVAAAVAMSVPRVTLTS